jgi:hypothetical protein
MVVIKPKQHWPWIEQRDGELGLSGAYVEKVFHKKA